MVDVQHWLSALPPGVLYLIVAGVIGVESMGIPLPGEIVLVSSALLAATGVVEPEWVATAAAAGAIIGDSVGYAVGRRGGRPLLQRLGRRSANDWSNGSGHAISRRTSPDTVRARTASWPHHCR